MDIIQRINELTEQRGWSKYKLASQSGLSPSTLANIYRRNTIPSIATLEALCDAFGITLSQFFAEDNTAVPLTPEQKKFFDRWSNLTPQQKNIIDELILEFK